MRLREVAPWRAEKPGGGFPPRQAVVGVPWCDSAELFSDRPGAYRR